MASAERPARRAGLGSALLLARVNLRRIRIDGAALAVLAGVVLLTAFAAVALPRFLNQVSDDALRAAVSDAAPINRNISIEIGDRIEPVPGDTFAGVEAEGERLRQEFTQPIQDIIGEQRYVLDSPSFTVANMPGEPPSAFPRFLRLRYQEDIEERMTLREGQLPQRAEPIEVSLSDEEPVSLPVFELAVTAETAARMEVGVGSLLVLTPQREDTLNQGISLSELDYNLIARISGIIDLSDPDEEYWFGDQRLHEPVLVETPDVVEIYAMGLLAPDAYAAWLEETVPSRWNYGWRYFVEPERMDAGEIDTITSELQALEVQFGAAGLVSVDEPRLRTGLVRIARQYESQRQLTLSMLSLAVAALGAIALAVTALLGALIAAGRRDATLLSRSRGASAGQLGWAQAIESLIVFVPAALLGLALATLIVAGRAPASVALIAVGVAVVAAAIVVLLALPLIRGDLGRLLGGTRPSERPGRHRIVIESVVVLMAIGGLVLFRRRGLEAGSLSNPDQGFDPFLTATPVLLALAIGIVLLRLYPLPVRLAAWLGSLRRGAVLFVGFRRIIQQPLAARLPLVVMLVATGIAVFSAVMLYSITTGQQRSTWHEVGADFRLEAAREGGILTSFVDVSGVESIEVTADGALLQARLLDAGVRGNFTLLALDIAEYQQIVAGTPADPEFPESMLVDQNVQNIGTPGNPIPALISSRWTAGARPEIGDTVEIQVLRQRFTIVVRGVRDNFPSLPVGVQFVVLPRDSVEAADPAIDTRGTYRYIKAPADAEADIKAALRERSPSTRVISRPDLLDRLANAPLVDGVENGFRVTVVLATLYAVLAALAGIALTSRDRARDLGYLRTLGLTTGQATVLTVIEQLPPAVLATLAGVGLGVGLVWLVEPGLDLSTFAGSTLPTEVLADPLLLTVVAGAELLAVLGAIAVYSYLTRRMNLGNVLRLGDRR